MGQYKVRHQTDFIHIPFKDINTFGNQIISKELLIRPLSIDALDRLIRQCRDLKLSMMEEQNGLDEQ